MIMMLRVAIIWAICFGMAAAAPLSELTENEAYAWGGLKEIGKRNDFPKAPERLPYPFRVWMEQDYLEECAYGPNCAPQRLLIWLGSDELSGTVKAFRTRPAFRWEVLAIENGTTKLGAGECITFVLQESYWKKGQHQDEFFTREHRPCLKAETSEERTARITREERARKLPKSTK
jgi:hypothetical protein